MKGVKKAPGREDDEKHVKDILGLGVRVSPGWRPVGSWSGKAQWHTAQTGTRR